MVLVIPQQYNHYCCDRIYHSQAGVLANHLCTFICIICYLQMGVCNSLMFVLIVDAFTGNYCEGAYNTSEYYQQHETRCKGTHEKQSTSADDVSVVAELANKQKHVSKAEMLNINKHRVVKDKQYKCLQCDKYFRTIQILNIHLLTHTREEQHYCKQCNKNFQCSSDLSEYMKTHKGKRTSKRLLHKQVQSGVISSTLIRHMRSRFQTLVVLKHI